jgi:hypothetical protein
MENGMKKRLTKEKQAELKALQKLPDTEIDYSDLPPVDDWSGAVVGRCYRPLKRR